MYLTCVYACHDNSSQMKEQAIEWVEIDKILNFIVLLYSKYNKLTEISATTNPWWLSNLCLNVGILYIVLFCSLVFHPVFPANKQWNMKHLDPIQQVTWPYNSTHFTGWVRRGTITETIARAPTNHSCCSKNTGNDVRVDLKLGSDVTGRVPSLYVHAWSGVLPLPREFILSHLICTDRITIA